MAMMSLNYRLLARRFIILPLVTLWLTCSFIYVVADIVIYLRGQINHAKMVNTLLAQTVTSNNSTTIANQVKFTLANAPAYESVIFFPVNATTQFSTDKVSTSTLLFGQYFGISEPVVAQISNNKTTTASTNNVNQFIGYINITINLSTLRKQWLRENLLLFSILLIIWVTILVLVVRRLQSLIQYLPNLESLSERILSNQLRPTDYQLVPKADDRWLVEQAISHLLSRQKLLLGQIEQLNQQQQQLSEDKFQQTQQFSSLQNTLTHEFKRAVNRIESGLQLLQHHYISNEQKDAIEMINLGTDDLNTKLNQIIQLTRIEKGQTTITRRQFSPTRLISDVLEQYQPFTDVKDLQLRSKVYHADYILEGDAAKIKLILSSLIENAIKFTHTGSIDVNSKLQHLESHIRWTLQVTDTGIGIKPNELEQIFEPFFQVDPNIKHSLNNQTVGLFIAKKLSELIGAELTAESKFGEGSTFTLSLVLSDWKQHYGRHLLSDKRLVIWQPSLNITTAIKLLRDAGAQVEGFNDLEVLLEQLRQQAMDMVIICPRITPEQVQSFAKTLRQQETNHRTLILYNQSPRHLTQGVIEKLSMSGVDYIESRLSPDMSVTDIQQLAEYLN
jgi:signal transduction histidine kinase